MVNNMGQGIKVVNGQSKELRSGYQIDNVYWLPEKKQDNNTSIQERDKELKKVPVKGLNKIPWQNLTTHIIIKGITPLSGFQAKVENTSSGKDDLSMDWQEKYIDKLDRDIDEIKNTITTSEDRISRMIDSAMTEMRDRDNQRLNEMSEIRASMENMQESMRSERRWVIGTTLTLAITAIIGIATMIITVLVSK